MRPLLVSLLAGALLGQTRQVAVIAHRGDHLRNPENTLAGFRSAAEIGADFIEVDIRTTRDGHLVLMHDRLVDRTTNGHGEVEGMTLAAIAAMEAGNGHRVPTLDDVLAVADVKTGVYLDCKSVAPQPLIDAIERHGMSGRVVLYGGVPFLKEVAALRPKLRAMPEAVNRAVLRELIAALGLRVAAFDARDWNEPTIAVAREAGIDLYVDRLGAADRPAMWQQAVDWGATGIQTDRPGELLRFLRSRGYHK